MEAASRAKLRRSCLGLVLPLNLNENFLLLGDDGVLGESKDMVAIWPATAEWSTESWFDLVSNSSMERVASSLAIAIAWSSVR